MDTTMSYRSIMQSKVDSYMKEHKYRPFNVRLSRATACEWCGVEIDEQPIEVPVHLGDSRDTVFLRMMIDNTMPKGELEVV